MLIGLGKHVQHFLDMLIGYAVLAFLLACLLSHPYIVPQVFPLTSLKSARAGKHLDSSLQKEDTLQLVLCPCGGMQVG